MIKAFVIENRENHSPIVINCSDGLTPKEGYFKDEEAAKKYLNSLRGRYDFGYLHIVPITISARRVYELFGR